LQFHDQLTVIPESITAAEKRKAEDPQYGKETATLYDGIKIPHSIYSPTGEVSKDKWGDEGLLSQKYRAKRVFNDPVGYNAAMYKDTNEVNRQIYDRIIEGNVVTMWDLSYPIVIDGQHWGGVRVAISKQQSDALIASRSEHLCFNI
jgi:hypothetical protein